MQTALKRKRQEAKIRLCDLAIKSGVNYSRLCCYQQGYEKPCYATAVKIAKALDCQVSDIFPFTLRGQKEIEG